MRVSVVIPTVGKSVLARAIKSVLDQTLPVYEILVCLDAAELPAIPDDARVKVLRVGPGAGGNAARQAGIDAASGELIALLDDDDVWHAKKLESQLAMVKINSGRRWIATSPVRAVFNSGKIEVWPSRLIKHGESLSRYIFRKSRVIGGVGFVQASTLLFPVSLAREFPFDVTLRHHQDIDWLHRIDLAVPDLLVLQCELPLVDYVVGQGSVSKRISAEQSIAWAQSNLGDDLRSLGDFVLTSASLYGARAGSPAQVLHALVTAYRLGRPGLPATLFAVANIPRAFVFALAARRGRL